MTAIGFVFVWWHRNKQPFRTRNLYLVVVVFIGQLLVVRSVIYQTAYDSCFFTQIIAVTCFTTDKVVPIVQVSSLFEKYSQIDNHFQLPTPLREGDCRNDTETR